ncbi:metallophosphatase domain-containing protein [Aspergillus stella-maris]|uniref:metallophosphatase domain-containing protein n=1 Tax=Aspergillus stella-maris TaxID=1810926 RepID=UPI003CCD6A88
MPFGKKSGLDSLLNRPEQETLFTRLHNSPTKTIATYLYAHRYTPKHKASASDQVPLRIVCISDTHNTTPTLPDGDILIHAGDLTQSGTVAELQAQLDWLASQPHKYKVIIAGNHDLCLDLKFAHVSTTGWSCTRREVLDWKGIIYLENNSRTLKFNDGNERSREIKVFGSPYTPKHGNWAFHYPRTNTSFWDEIIIAEDTDMLITHGPPRGHLDLDHLGCVSLRQRLWSMRRRPKLHVFGHIHGGYGRETVKWDSMQRTYENFLDGQPRLLSFLFFVCLWLFDWLRGILIGGRSAWQQTTVMVNAAVVGGVRDEKRREAIMVDL